MESFINTGSHNEELEKKRKFNKDKKLGRFKKSP